MDIITSLFHQDVFLAVASYLAAGSACLVYFLYREKKWERELAQYRFGAGKPEDGGRAMQAPDICRPDGNARKPQADDEMRVIADGNEYE